MATIRVRSRGRTPRRHDAKKFFEEVVVPLWHRFEGEIEAIDLCCAVAVMLDQMPEWIASDEQKTPNAVRKELGNAEPDFVKLNLVGRAIKHVEVGSGSHKGLRDVISNGFSEDPSWAGGALSPVFFLRDGTATEANELLRKCVHTIAARLNVEI